MRTRALLAATALSPIPLAQEPLAVLDGPQSDDSFGAAAISPGDLDGDGWADLAVGAPGKDSSSTQTPGAVHLFSGADSTLVGTALGAFGGTRFGATLAAAGDLDGDGVNDLLVGAPDQAGRVVALDGAALANDQEVELWSVDGLGSGQLGRSLTLVDDLDGDGVADVAAGEPFYNVLSPEVGPGRVALFSGSDGTPLGVIDGPQDDLATFGWSLVAVDDLDRDGVRDLAVGAPTADGGADLSGAVYFASTLQGTLLDSVEGQRANGQLGFALAAGPRLDDGTSTLFAGEPADTALPAESGSVLWLEARAGTTLRALAGPPGGGFGRALSSSTDGRWLAVGAPFGATENGSSGTLYVIDADARRRRLKLDGVDEDSEFGRTAAWLEADAVRSDARLAVGAPGFDSTLDGDEGRVEIYALSDLVTTLQ